MNKKKIIIFSFLVIMFFYLVWSNVTFMTTRYTIESGKIPKEFDGFKIVQVSDLHNANYGKDNSKLIKTIKKQKPDMIAVTGDFIDGSKPNVKAAEEMAKNLVEIAPCYYVSGNHEASLEKSKFDEFIEVIKGYGVNVLENDVSSINKNEVNIQIVGLQDLIFLERDAGADNSEDIKLEDFVDSDYSALENNEKINKDLYTIVLEHRPTFIDYFSEKDTDLVLTGHAHGGWLRIPFVGGLVAPDQGLFPKYDAGKYTKDDTVMIVSRGLGNSIIPFRVNNRPELVVVELKSK